MKVKVTKTKLIILGVILIAGGYWFYQSAQKKQVTPQYQTEKTEKGTLIVSITGTGQVSSANNTSVTTGMSGVVSEVYVKSGDYVTAGSQLIKLSLDQESAQKQSQAYAAYLNAVSQEKQSRIDKVSAQAKLEQARKAVLDAQTDVDIMEANLGASRQNPATKESYKQNEIDSIRSTLTSAKQNFSVAEQQYLSSDTSIQSEKASLGSAWIDYQNTSNVITAPVSGTITNFTLQKGSTLASTSSSSDSSSSNNSSTTQKIATIKTNAKPGITVNLSEVDIPKVQIGNKVSLTADAFEDKTFTGKITDIDTTGVSSSGVVTFPVTVTLDTENEQLYPNMTVIANIITATKDNVLLIPSSAVQRQNDQATVRIVKNGNVQQVDVQTGLASDTQVEIISGLADGDQVVTSTLSTQISGQSTTTSPFGGGGFGGRGGGGNVRIIR
jgi:membrane fusion protein, macrolide-specific efflux system